jgi:hypothetical protein
MFEQVKRRVPYVGERPMRRISLAVLLALFLVNLLPCVLYWGEAGRIMSVMLYALNALTIALMCCTLLFPSFFLKNESFLGTLESLLIAIIAVMFTSTALVSCIITFGDDFTVDGPVVFVSSILAVAVYVAYIAKLYSEKNML